MRCPNCNEAMKFWEDKPYFECPRCGLQIKKYYLKFNENWKK